MADVTNNWQGGTPADLDAAGNWTTGAAPGANDRAYFLAQYDGVSGPTGDMAALAAIDLDALIIGEKYSQSIGGSGSEFSIAADLVWVRSDDGTLWHKTTALTTDLCIVDSTSSNPLSHDAYKFTGATLTELDVLRGKATVLSGGTVTNCFVGNKDQAVSEAHLTIAAGATSVTRVEQWGGFCDANISIATVHVHGGVFTQDITVTGSTELRVYPGARANLKFAGTYVAIHVYPGGILDVSAYGSRKIVTSAYFYPGARIIGDELLKVTNYMLRP